MEMYLLNICSVQDPYSIPGLKKKKKKKTLKTYAHTSPIFIHDNIYWFWKFCFDIKLYSKRCLNFVTTSSKQVFLAVLKHCFYLLVHCGATKS